MTHTPQGMLSCRSPLQAASNSHTRPMSRHFNGPVYFWAHFMGSWFTSFQRFHVDGRNDSITLRKDAYIFEHGENISVFKKYQDTCGWALVIKLCLSLLRPSVIRCQDHLSPTKIRNCFRNLNSLHIKQLRNILETYLESLVRILRIL